MGMIEIFVEHYTTIVLLSICFPKIHYICASNSQKKLLTVFTISLYTCVLHAQVDVKKTTVQCF